MTTTRAPAPALSRFTPAHTSPIVTETWQACWEGREPAETLDAAERELLVAFLVDAGLTDREIAAHTRMTLYTTARIRDRLDLPPNAATVAVGSGRLDVAEMRLLRERYRSGEPVVALAEAYAMEVRHVRHICRDLLTVLDYAGAA